MSATRLALLVPYFGRVPDYADLWLESCRRNPGIDWILLTDCRFDHELPPNVYVHSMSFAGLADRLAERFDFALGLETPYKLCDFRPAFGHVLADYLKGYDFWGYCDLDVIFGDIRKFVTESVLDSSDKVFTGGHLSFMRNDEEINRTYQDGAKLGLLDFRTVFSSPRSFAFDEWGLDHDGLNSILLSRSAAVHLSEMPYADIKVGHYALRTNREGFTQSPGEAEQEQRKRHIAYTWVDGVLTQHAVDSLSGEVVRREEAYIHLQKRPMRRDPSLGPAPSTFAILPPNRFVPHPAVVDRQFLEANCRERRPYLHHHRLQLARLRKRVAAGVLRRGG